MDTALLEYEMKKMEKSKDDICNELDISRTALYRKMTGRSDFTRTEISKLIKYLSLTDDKVISIFFNRKVS